MNQTPSNHAASGEASAWSPFRYTAFTVLWTATVISNVGTWMHDVGAGWLMTELSPSPAIVAAVQAATTLPVFLFALLAGAIADIVDRRQMLIWVNVFMSVTASLLAILVAAGAMTPMLLLVFTFLMGTGAAFMAPAWQAIVPKLVERKDLANAIALNSVGINVSRAIGPALAGFLIVGVGLAAPFALNAVSTVLIIAALVWWRPPPTPQATLPAENVLGAIRAGVRYTVNSKPMRATLIRAGAFFLFASAFWAMLPLIARDVLNGGPTLYGILLASVGAGAVTGAFVLPPVRKRLGANGTVFAGTLGTVLVLVVLATVPNAAAAIGVAALAGLSWIAVLSSLHVSAQTALPDWVRARGLSVFLTVFFGAMAAGSLIWGQVATHLTIEAGVLIAAGGATVFALLTLGVKLGAGEGLHLAPSSHWPEPVVSDDLGKPDGPVRIEIVYVVAEDNRAAFQTLMLEMRTTRQRTGGYGWTLMQDAQAPERFVETWFEPSWLDHLRTHDRVSEDDRALQDKLLALHSGPERPNVTHLVTAAAGPSKLVKSDALK